MLQKTTFRIIRSKEIIQISVVKYPREINGDNLKTSRHEASRHFRNKKQEYLKNKINALATNNVKKSAGDPFSVINEFSKGCNLKVT
jgi:hypothetical protein